MAKIKLYRGIGAGSQEELDRYISEFMAGGKAGVHSGNKVFGDGDYFALSKSMAQVYTKGFEYSHIFEFEIDDKLLGKAKISPLLPHDKAEEKLKVATDGKVGAFLGNDVLIITDRDSFLKAASGLPTEKQAEQKINAELAKFYAKYLTDLKLQLTKWLENYGDLSFSQKLQVERLLNVENTIKELIGEPSTGIKQTIQYFVLTQGNNAYNSVWYQLEQGFNINLDFAVLDPHYLENLMNMPVAGSNLSKRLKDNVDTLAKASNDAIARGFMLGKSYADIALDISTQTQASYNRAVRIARTEGGRVSSLTTQKGYEEAVSNGVHMQKMWVATLDSKTRIDHGQVDGQIVDVDGYFNVGGYKALGPHQVGVAREDINCRCTSRPIVSGISPTVRLDNEKKVTTEWKPYSEWIKEKNKK